ncbi:U-box domain-containing protein 14-like [Punica granatum]|uniref:U-box domain-containing protein n=2 Tax=Punica granatum TaxID=22663 RepID=A0A218XK72_PUNGR|nr:U-box domain-containing protein 14-like [Punica granatum]OWM85357.1 hypothetical protein CDL15_Pgr018981 [Punica granatum]PKI74058.1 hypothetical protein CRG98_005536 [Punica granatum]
MSNVSTPRARDTIVQCVLEARSSFHEKQQRALQMLASLTKVSAQNRSLLAQSEGAIPTLLALSKSPSSTVQTLALSVLFNLSLNPDLKLLLADMETIHSLNSVIILSTSPESSRLASSLICSLALLDKNKAKFGVAGTIQLLVKAICGPMSPDVAHHLLSSLAELVQFHGNCTLAVRSGAIPALLRLAESSDEEDLAATSLTILGLLARFDEGLRALRKTDGIVASMVDVIVGRSMLSKEGAADVLLRLFDESEGCIRDALRLSELSTVLADLSVRGSSRAREKAALLMKKMMEVESYADGNSILYEW